MIVSEIFLGNCGHSILLKLVRVVPGTSMVVSGCFWNFVEPGDSVYQVMRSADVSHNNGFIIVLLQQSYFYVYN